MKKKIIIAIASVVVLVGVFLTVYFLTRPKISEGSKHYTLTVVDDMGAEKKYQGSTDAEYLYEALSELEGLTLEGEDGPYGFTVMSVNELEANFNVSSAYWSIYVNGEYGNYSLSEQPVTDGDEYALKYETF